MVMSRVVALLTLVAAALAGCGGDTIILPAGGAGGVGGEGGEGGEPAAPADPCNAFEADCCSQPGCVLAKGCVSESRHCYFRACQETDAEAWRRDCPAGMRCEIFPANNAPNRCTGAETCLANTGYCTPDVP
jgi:hypothetical protein